MSEEQPHTEQGTDPGQKGTGENNNQQETLGVQELATTHVDQEDAPSTNGTTHATESSDTVTGATGVNKNDDSSAPAISGKQPHPPNPSMAEFPSKRPKREWLAFHGVKHTRVGADFQVASLPPVESRTVAGDNGSENNKGKK